MPSTAVGSAAGFGAAWRGRAARRPHPDPLSQRGAGGTPAVGP